MSKTARFIAIVFGSLLGLTAVLGAAIAVIWFAEVPRAAQKFTHDTGDPATVARVAKWFGVGDLPAGYYPGAAFDLVLAKSLVIVPTPDDGLFRMTFTATMYPHAGAQSDLGAILSARDALPSSCRRFRWIDARQIRIRNERHAVGHIRCTADGVSVDLAATAFEEGRFHVVFVAYGVTKRFDTTAVRAALTKLR